MKLNEACSRLEIARRERRWLSEAREDDSAIHGNRVTKDANIYFKDSTEQRESDLKHRQPDEAETQHVASFAPMNVVKTAS